MSEMQVESASHGLHSNIPTKEGITMCYDVCPQAHFIIYILKTCICLAVTSLTHSFIQYTPIKHLSFLTIMLGTIRDFKINNRSMGGRRLPQIIEMQNSFISTSKRENKQLSGFKTSLSLNRVLHEEN